MNVFVEKDLHELEGKFIFKENLRDTTVMVTGGTGLIGSLLLLFLDMINQNNNLKMTVIGVCRNKEKAKALKCSKVEWVFSELDSDINYQGNVDYIIHTASPTQSFFLSNNPVEVITQTVLGTYKLLSFAKNHNTKSFVYLSSMEVYGQNYSDKPIIEKDLGYINILSPRSSYSEGKRIIECLCSSYYHEYGVDVKIARLTQTFGCGIQKEDNRVFAQFCRSAISGEDIVLHTIGDSAKSYLYTTDAVNALFYILFRGKAAEAYNVANPETYISIKDMAYFVKDNFNEKINVVIELNDNMGYAPSTRAKLDVMKIQNLGWYSTVSLKDMYQRTIDYLYDT